MRSCDAVAASALRRSPWKWPTLLRLSWNDISRPQSPPSRGPVLALAIRGHVRQQPSACADAMIEHLIRPAESAGYAVDVHVVGYHEQLEQLRKIGAVYRSWLVRLVWSLWSPAAPPPDATPRT